MMTGENLQVHQNRNLRSQEDIGERCKCDRIAALAPFSMCEPVGMWEMAHSILRAECHRYTTATISNP